MPHWIFIGLVILGSLALIFILGVLVLIAVVSWNLPTDTGWAEDD